MAVPTAIDPAVEKAREAALRLLDRMRRTRRELERKLAEKGHPPAAVAGALDRLARVGLVDDVAYARAFVRAQWARRPTALRLVRQKLKLRGVSDGDLEQAFAGAGVGSGDDPEGEALGSAGEQVRATRALAPLLRRYSALEPRDARNRCAAALARRGFDYETISRVVAAALAPVPDGRDDA